MAEILTTPFDYSEHREAFQAAQARLLAERPPLDPDSFPSREEWATAQWERTRSVVGESVAYSLSQAENQQSELAHTGAAFHEFRIAVRALKETGQLTDEEVTVSPTPSNKELFGEDGFSRYQNFAQLVRGEADAGDEGYKIVRLYKTAEQPARAFPRLRKCASWLVSKVARRQSKEVVEESSPNYLRRKADAAFDAIWQEVADSPHDDETRESLKTYFDRAIDDHVSAVNQLYFKRDIRVLQSKKYRNSAMATDLAHRYGLSNSDAKKTVKEHVKLPAYSPLRLATETVEISRFARIMDKRRALGVLAMYGAGSSVAMGLLPEMAGRIMESGADLKSLGLASGVAAAGYAARGMLWGKTEELTGEVCETLNNKIANTLFEGDPKELAEFDPSRLYNALNEGKRALEDTLHALVHTVMTNAIITGTAVASLAAKSPLAAGVAVASVIPTYFLTKKVTARYYTQRERAIKEKNKSAKYLQDATKAVNFLRTVTRRQGAEQEVQAALNRSERVERAARSRYFRNFFLAKIPMAAATQAPTAVMGALEKGADAIANSTLAGPQIVWNIAGLFDYFANAGDSGQRIEELKKVCDAVSAEQEKVVPESHAITLKDLLVVLPKRPKELEGKKRRLLDMRGSEIEIPQGSFTTFVGPSGSGKTTTVGVLAGFIGHQGSATIGGVPANQVQTNKVISYAPQAAHFNTKQTVLENLLPGYDAEERAAKRSEIEKILLDLELDKFIDDLDEFMRDNPSGGEVKRLNLVRALVEKSKIVVLDEPTSELDGCSELNVYRVLSEYRKANPDTTIIAITHDDDLQAMSDQVVDFGKLTSKTSRRRSVK